MTRLNKSISLMLLMLLAITLLSNISILPTKAYGWELDSGVLKYVTNSGAYSIGWTYVDSKWYYFDSDGSLKTGLLKDQGKCYYLNSNGDIATGWKQIDGKWYYFNSHGQMACGEIISIKGKKHKFNDSGIWVGTMSSTVSEELANQMESTSYADDDLSSSALSSVSEEESYQIELTAYANDDSLNNTSSNVSGQVTYQMESTAYTGGGITATGTVPVYDPSGISTIAVDPNVIPLGSKVYVSGYGIAIAADTGGAIKGNIVDVYLNSNDECFNWGRRQVEVTILAYPGAW